MKLVQRIEKGLEWGPLKTEFHRTLVSSAFRHAFARLLAEEVEPQLTIRVDHFTGSVEPSYNEDRYTGPNSVCKYRFRLRCCFFQGKDIESVDAEIEYDPDTQRFQRPIRVWTLVDRENWRRLDEALIGMRDSSCPWCGGRVVRFPFRVYCADRYCFSAACRDGLRVEDDPWGMQ